MLHTNHQPLHQEISRVLDGESIDDIIDKLTKYESIRLVDLIPFEDVDLQDEVSEPPEAESETESEDESEAEAEKNETSYIKTHFYYELGFLGIFLIYRYIDSA